MALRLNISFYLQTSLKLLEKHFLAWKSVKVWFLSESTVDFVGVCSWCRQNDGFCVCVLLSRQDLCERVSCWFLQHEAGSWWAGAWILFALWTCLFHLHWGISQGLLNLFSRTPAAPSALCHSMSLRVITFLIDDNHILYWMNCFHNAFTDLKPNTSGFSASPQGLFFHIL